MTDEVIEKALMQQPAAIKSISANKIINTLKARRNFLLDEVMEYYKEISETVSVIGSDKKELFDIARNDDGSVTIQVFKTDKNGDQTVKMYERNFDEEVTDEIRLYGFDGDDRFLLHGKTDKIRIRMIGGGGDDVYESTEKPIADVILYDNLKQNNKIAGDFRNKFSKDSTVNTFDRLGYKYPFLAVFVTAGFNPDDGISLGPTYKLITHGFRKTPYQSIHKLKATYSFSTKAVRFKYSNEYISLISKKTDLITDLEFKGPNNTSNFFGSGVNSVYDKTKEDKFRYYRIRYDMGDLSLQLRHRVTDNVTLALGPAFQLYSLDSTDRLNLKRNVFLQTSSSGLNRNTLFKKQYYLGALFSFTIDTRNNKVLPEKGINWNTNVKYLTGLNKVSYDNITQINSDFIFYINLIPSWLTFANRTGGGITLGDAYEFYQSQYLGSDENLRGYRKERFAGQSKFYNQSELRLKLFNMRTYLFPASLGIFTFFDNGRVWVKNDTVKKYLTGYGGGIWFSPLRRFVLTVSYSISKEDKIPLAGFSWKF
jgi:hypothetical protein